MPFWSSASRKSGVRVKKQSKLAEVQAIGESRNKWKCQICAALVKSESVFELRVKKQNEEEVHTEGEFIGKRASHQ